MGAKTKRIVERVEEGALQKREAEAKLKVLRPLVKKVLEAPAIRSDAANQEAADARRVVVSTKKGLEEERKSATKPLDEAKKRIMNWFRPMIVECDEALKLIDEKIGEFEDFRFKEAEKLREEERKREEKRLAQLRRNEEKKLKEAESREERLAIKRQYEEKRGVVEDEALAAQSMIVEEAVPVEGMQTRKLWDFEILDIDQVPDLYLIKTVDRRKVIEECKAQAERGREPSIPGLRVFQKVSRASRSL